MSIDWSKAPDGATHFQPSSGLFRVDRWFKDDFASVFVPSIGNRWIDCEDDDLGSLADVIERPTPTENPVDQPKPLTQAVFEGLPSEYRWAVVYPDGEAVACNVPMDRNVDKELQALGHMWGKIGIGETIGLGRGYDTTNWQNSLIERQDVSSRVEQLRSVEAARQIESTLAERQNQYGDFSDVAHLSQGLQSLLSVGSFSDVQQEAIQMICSKLARLACGDADHVDSWHDIAGYATLVVKDLESGK